MTRPQTEVHFIPGEVETGPAPSACPQRCGTHSESVFEMCSGGTITFPADKSHSHPDGIAQFSSPSGPPTLPVGAVGPWSSPALWSVCFSEHQEAAQGAAWSRQLTGWP